MTHFEANHLAGINNKFCLEMLFSENCNFWLPKDFMNRYFKADTLELEFTIRFGKIHMWSFKVNRLWESHYYIVDFSQITKDLYLIYGDVIVFELVVGHVFNILFFRPNGIESAFPEVAFTVGVDEHEQTKEMDLIKDLLVDGSQQGMDYEQQDVSDGNDDVSFQDEPVLEDDVVNVSPDVPVVEAEPHKSFYMFHIFHQLLINPMSTN
ncbi:putative transcription factor B3-Domain family [Helianthus annuus]|nr:putative transcription factor B3-Domain family [Helianthus annuus]